jgi:Tfp pilus assembly protein PilX
MFYNPRTAHKESGQLLVLVLVFGAIFLIMISSFISSVVTQARVVDVRFEQQRATEIAEAGLNYYKWYLAHFPGDVTGSGTYVYTDPEDGAIGEYDLAITSNSYCGEISSLRVQSTGRTYENVNAKAVISATYKRPTIAEYSFISNASVQYGASRVITGPVHGNQGVRMDGFHNSFVGAGVATFDGNDGVYTTTGNATPGLFQYPISPIDFIGLTIDMAQMRTSAQADGIYYGPSGGWGYQIVFKVFNGNSTVDVYRVTNTRDYWAYSEAENWHAGERNDILNRVQIAKNLSIDPDCPVLFFEDKLWIEGVINQKVAVAAGLNSGNAQNNIVIHDNVTYVPGTNAGLVAIAEDDVDIGIDVPNNMIANGIYIAQNGRFGRNHYRPTGHPNGGGLPSVINQFVSRDSLTRLGSVISNLGGGTEWINTATNAHLSGFRSRITSFDRDQVDNPPPLTPETSDVYELQDWRSEG